MFTIVNTCSPLRVVRAVISVTDPREDVPRPDRGRLDAGADVSAGSRFGIDLTRARRLHDVVAMLALPVTVG